MVYMAVYKKPGTLTAASLTPWGLHAIFWAIHTFTPVSTDSLMWLLVLYNLSLYAVGGICLDYWLRRGPRVMPKAGAFGEPPLKLCSTAGRGCKYSLSWGHTHKLHTRALSLPFLQQYSLDCEAPICSLLEALILCTAAHSLPAAHPVTPVLCCRHPSACFCKLLRLLQVSWCNYSAACLPHASTLLDEALLLLRTGITVASTACLHRPCMS